jgi:hypothetical protein
MSQLRLRVLFAGVAALLLGLSSCAVKKTTDGYSLKQIESQYFLLPPDTPASEEREQKISIPVSAVGSSGEAPDTKDCSIKAAWFSFYRAPESKFWTVEIPTVRAWAKSGGTVDMKEEWQGFEAALHGLEQRRCFSSLDDYLQVKQRIAANLPAPADETLFYRYGYGPGGYVDLAQGMQLRIERDLYSGNDSEQPRPADYRGTTITSYGVLATAPDAVKLDFLRIDKKSAGATGPDATSLDVNLAAQFASSPRLRLFLQDLVVSGNAKTPAILIGASSENDLNAVTAEIATKPQIDCRDLLRWKVTCAIFRGPVTVSPMLQVTVNGAVTYIPIGSKLWFVLPYRQGAQETKLLQTVRVQRPFQGKMTEVLFARNQEGVTQLLLMGEDRISWSRKFAEKK